MGKQKRQTARTLTEIPRGLYIRDHSYSEGDIAWLESQDLADSDVTMALMVAYQQSDPKFGRGFRRSTSWYALGSARELRAQIAEAEEQLKENPKHYDTRMKRMESLAALARDAKERASK